MSWPNADLVAARRSLRALTPRTVALIASIAVQRGSHQLGSELQLGICALLDTTGGRAAEDLLPWHQLSQSCATMTCLLIGEQLLHGYDIAQALGAEWPIRRSNACGPLNS